MNKDFVDPSLEEYVYDVDKNNCIHIFSCKGHYED